MIAEIRAHIKEIIKKCDSRYMEIDNPFPRVEDIVETKVSKQYVIIFNSTAKILADHDDSMDDVSLTLRTYVQGGKSKLKAFDEGFSNAMLIKALLLDISSINSKEYIKGIDSSDIVPAEVSDSQDIYTFETTFNFKISYGIGE